VFLCPDAIHSNISPKNESLGDMHIFEYSTMDPRNSSPRAFLAPVRQKKVFY
jgi:hypothetical protein